MTDPLAQLLDRRDAGLARFAAVIDALQSQAEADPEPCTQNRVVGYYVSGTRIDGSPQWACRDCGAAQEIHS